MGAAGRDEHRDELAAECLRVLEFATASRHPDGGFALLDERGRPELDRPVEAYVTARMTHVFALGQLLGVPGSADLVEHGLAGLRGLLRDRDHDGWYAAVEPGGRPTDAGKKAYEHAFVVLAASSAAVAGADRALLGEALGVVEQHFWSEADGMMVEEWDRGWQLLDPYRGANANMHTVEAFLAAADAGADPVWRRRALRIAERLIHQVARSADWMLPEHYDAGWAPLPEFNRDAPADRFRPYGVTIGHLLEWSRLVLGVRAALGPDAPGWLLPAAQGLFDRALELGWAVDGADGFVYTVDFAGRPVVRQRMHWVVAEALAAAATLHRATGADRYAAVYARTWDYASRYLIDRVGGSWWHELDPANRPAATVWAGKPDAYHVVQAVLLPRLAVVPSLAAALARGELDSVRPPRA
jgi:sulfoquinovose isomerase